MILSDKQAMMLYQIAVDSLCIIGEPFKFSPPDRIKLVDEILEQQSNTLIDLEKMDEL